jgi:hypothetical protein
LDIRHVILAYEWHVDDPCDHHNVYSENGMTDKKLPDVYFRSARPGQPVSPDLLGSGKWSVVTIDGGDWLGEEWEFVLFVWPDGKFEVICAPEGVDPGALSPASSEIALIKLAAVRE